jgi:hypothetical protein
MTHFSKKTIIVAIVTAMLLIVSCSNSSPLSQANGVEENGKPQPKLFIQILEFNEDFDYDYQALHEEISIILYEENRDYDKLLDFITQKIGICKFLYDVPEIYAMSPEGNFVEIRYKKGHKLFTTINGVNTCMEVIDVQSDGVWLLKVIPNTHGE